MGYKNWPITTCIIMQQTCTLILRREGTCTCYTIWHKRKNSNMQHFQHTIQTFQSQFFWELGLALPCKEVEPWVPRPSLESPAAKCIERSLSKFTYQLKYINLGWNKWTYKCTCTAVGWNKLASINHVLTETVIGAVVGPWTWSCKSELKAWLDIGPLNVCTAK